LNSVSCALDSSDTHPIAFAFAMVDGTIGDEPSTYHDVIDNNKSREWLIAMNEEIESLEKNKT
jgi:hypothetical protein